MHMSLATFMNFYMVYVLDHYNHISPTTALYLYIAAAVWSAWIGLTRLYLGVHTPVDIVVGTGVGICLLGFWTGISGLHLSWVKVWPAAIWLHLALMLLALCTYPKPLHHTTSYLYAVTFLGAWIGMLVCDWPMWWATIGTWVEKLLGSCPPQLVQALAVMARPASPAAAAAQSMAASVCRIVCGLVVVLATRAVSKVVLVKLLPVVLGCLPRSLRRACQPPICVDYSQIRQSYSQGALDGNGDGNGAGAATGHQMAYDAVDGSAGLLRRRQGKGGSSGSAAAAAGAKVHGTSNAPDAAVGQPHGAGVAAAVAAAAAGSLKLDTDAVHEQHGVLLRPDGYPWDADVLRRFISYTCAVTFVVAWHHLLRTAAWFWQQSA